MKRLIEGIAKSLRLKNNLQKDFEAVVYKTWGGQAIL
jgi:hypothetical protein